MKTLTWFLRGLLGRTGLTSGRVAVLLAGAGLLATHGAAAQTEEILKARKVSKKINIRFYPPKANPIEYVVDEDYRNPDSKKLISPMSVVATDRSFKILTRFANPLIYTVHISQSAVEDPSVQQTNEFLTGLTQLFGQMGASQFIKGNLAQESKVSDLIKQVSEGNKVSFVDNTANAPSALDSKTFALSTVRGIASHLRSQEALTISFWLYNGANNLACKDKLTSSYRASVLSNLVLIEDKLYAFPDSAKLLVKSMITPQTYPLLRDELPRYDKFLAKLNFNITSTRRRIALLEQLQQPLIGTSTSAAPAGGKSKSKNKPAAAATTTYPPLEGCDNIILYINTLQDNYLARVTEQLKIREALTGQFASMLASIRKEMDEADRNRFDEDYFVEKGYIEAEPGKIKNVEIRVVQNNVNFESDNSTLSITKQDLLTSTLRVRPYSALVAEVGVGVVFTNLLFPKYGVATNGAGQQVVTNAGEDKVNVIPVTMLNVYPAGLNTNIYPLLQLGMGTGQGRPTIFLGTGLRFLQPFNRVTLTAGAVWTWRRELDELNLGDVVAGQAVVENHLTYQFQDRPKPYLGIQYNF